MTKPDDLTEAQEKLLTLGLAIYTGDDRSNMARTSAGHRLAAEIEAAKVAAE